MQDLESWVGCPRPMRVPLEGCYCRLEPLDASRHGEQLYTACTLSESSSRFRYLPEHPPSSFAEFTDWLDTAQSSEDPLYFAVIDLSTGKVEGRQTLMRIDESNGVIQIGHIYWGDNISRTPVTTEAFYLFANYIFEDLGYRRFEWKCNDANGPSKSAAMRYGMSPEGVFRQAGVVKGVNRDTAWFSLLDIEWQFQKLKFSLWLSPDNFDISGTQIIRLEDIDLG